MLYDNHNLSFIFMYPCLTPVLELPTRLQRRDTYTNDTYSFVYNTYIYNNSLDVNGNKCIHCLIRIPKVYNDRWTTVYNRLNNEHLFIEIDLGEEQDFYHKLFVFNIPERFHADYELFEKGKYSKMSNEIKGLILLDRYDNDDEVRMILNKDIRLKEKKEAELDIKIPDDVDYWDCPNVDNETFDLEYYKKLLNEYKGENHTV